jgi:hypothetical protein
VCTVRCPYASRQQPSYFDAFANFDAGSSCDQGFWGAAASKLITASKFANKPASPGRWWPGSDYPTGACPLVTLAPNGERQQRTLANGER